MRNNEFIRAVRLESKLKKEKTVLLMEALSASISKILSEGDSLSIQGFGTFELKKKNERLSVNPSTGKRFMIPPKLLPVFRPGISLKNKVKNFGSDEQ
ncbi:MAG: HU family DNA-binding protein [Bacteroidales bacterium]|nr:HU family DNA-binding protein [Bacteroidales bacterium]MDD3431272.1 HU family DNA-binding protein [Bacteroidales bacterium]MDD4360873.1 HU family DNA-binding protein [Bacteroidales bacterium]MDD4430602.1 HU family DNA-binding protein [Bacteroidales bacterium]